MAKIKLPLVGFAMSTKELLIVIGAVVGVGYLIKRDIEQKVTKGISYVAKTVKPITYKPGYAIFDWLNPKVERDPNKFDISWRREVSTQIRDAQEGKYTHRADSKH